MMKLDGVEVNAIASDLDGTLMGDRGCVSEESFRVIQELSESGVHFVAASGRQYENVEKLFEPIKDEISFICENGSVIVRNGEIIHMECIEDELVYALIDDLKKDYGDIVIIVSTEGKVFAESLHADFVEQRNKLIGQSFRLTESFKLLKNPKNKVSVIFQDGIVRAERIRAKYAGILESVDAGDGWLDFTAKNVSKGRAMRYLRDKVLGGDARFASFGDSGNDVSMFPESVVSYAMNTSAEAVKSAATHICIDVTDKLWEMLDTNPQ